MSDFGNPLSESCNGVADYAPSPPSEAVIAPLVPLVSDSARVSESKLRCQGGCKRLVDSFYVLEGDIIHCYDCWRDKKNNVQQLHLPIAGRLKELFAIPCWNESQTAEWRYLDKNQQQYESELLRLENARYYDNMVEYETELIQREEEKKRKEAEYKAELERREAEEKRKEEEYDVKLGQRREEESQRWLQTGKAERQRLLAKITELLTRAKAQTLFEKENAAQAQKVITQAESLIQNEKLQKAIGILEESYKWKTEMGRSFTATMNDFDSQLKTTLEKEAWEKKQKAKITRNKIIRCTVGLVVAGLVIAAIIIRCRIVQNEWNERQTNVEATVYEEPVLTQTATVNNPTLNLRAGHSIGAGIIKKLKRGDKLTVTGEATNGWLPVEHEGDKGWVSAELIRTD